MSTGNEFGDEVFEDDPADLTEAELEEILNAPVEYDPLLPSDEPVADDEVEGDDG